MVVATPPIDGGQAEVERHVVEDSRGIADLTEAEPERSGLAMVAFESRVGGAESLARDDRDEQRLGDDARGRPTARHFDPRPFIEPLPM